MNNGIQIPATPPPYTYAKTKTETQSAENKKSANSTSEVFGFCFRPNFDFCLRRGPQSKHDRYLWQFLVALFQKPYPRCQWLFAARPSNTHRQNSSIFLFMNTRRHCKRLGLFLLEHRPVEHLCSIKCNVTKTLFHDGCRDIARHLIWGQKYWFIWQINYRVKKHSWKFKQQLQDTMNDDLHVIKTETYKATLWSYTMIVRIAWRVWDIPVYLYTPLSSLSISLDNCISQCTCMAGWEMGLKNWRT